MRLEIKSDQVETFEGVAAKTGKPFSMRIQYAFVAMNDGEIRKVRIILDRDQPAYKRGFYRLHEDSFTVGNYGDIQVRPVLEPVAAPSAQKTA